MRILIGVLLVEKEKTTSLLAKFSKSTILPVLPFLAPIGPVIESPPITAHRTARSFSGSLSAFAQFCNLKLHFLLLLSLTILSFNFFLYPPHHV